MSSIAHNGQVTRAAVPPSRPAHKSGWLPRAALTLRSRLDPDEFLRPPERSGRLWAPAAPGPTDVRLLMVTDSGLGAAEGEAGRARLPQLRQLPTTAAIALRRRVADAPDRKTAKPPPRLAAHEPPSGLRSRPWAVPAGRGDRGVPTISPPPHEVQGGSSGSVDSTRPGRGPAALSSGYLPPGQAIPAGRAGPVRCGRAASSRCPRARRYGSATRTGLR